MLKYKVFIYLKVFIFIKFYLYLNKLHNKAKENNEIDLFV